MVPAVREAAAYQKVKLGSPSTGFEIRSPGTAKFMGRITLQVHNASGNTRREGCTEVLLDGPEAHFMFLSIQSLKGSTLVKAV